MMNLMLLLISSFRALLWNLVPSVFCPQKQNGVLHTCVPKRRLGINSIVFYVVVLMVPLLSGCVAEISKNISEYNERTRDGAIRVKVSEYDGTTIISMNPASIRHISQGKSDVSFGLFYKNYNDIYMVIEVYGIANIYSMGINIDGKLYEFSNGFGTEFVGGGEDHYESIESFKTDVDFLIKMAYAKKVIMQIRTSEGIEEEEFLNGCDAPGKWDIDTWSACYSLRRFINKHLQPE